MLSEGPTGFSIRDAIASDAPAIANLHVRVWSDAYRNLAPAQVLAANAPASRLARWSAALAEPAAGHSILVAEIEGAIAAFIAVGAPDHPAYGGRGMIRALYIDRDRHRLGLGRHLLRRGAARLAQLGHSAMALAVVDGNAPAIAFYEAMGGRRVGRFIDAGPLWKSDNLVYAWDDLRALHSE